MRLNLFQYHVQNRLYTSGEIFKLVNHHGFTHTTLSGQKLYFNTLGASAEAMVFLPTVGTMALGLFAGVNLLGIPTVFYATRFLYPSHNISKYANDTYAGTEVTAFLNKHYNVILNLTKRNEQYDQILKDFLDHNYLNEDVPTPSWFDFSIAVLDIVKISDQNQPYEHHGF